MVRSGCGSCGCGGARNLGDEVFPEMIGWGKNHSGNIVIADCNPDWYEIRQSIVSGRDGSVLCGEVRDFSDAEVFNSVRGILDMSYNGVSIT